MIRNTIRSCIVCIVLGDRIAGEAGVWLPDDALGPLDACGAVVTGELKPEREALRLDGMSMLINFASFESRLMKLTCWCQLARLQDYHHLSRLCRVQEQTFSLSSLMVD